MNNKNSWALAACLVASGVATAQAPASNSASADGESRAAPLAVKSLMLDVAQGGERLIAVGERGHVLLSDDQGANWRQANAVPSRTMLTAVHFSDANNGWAVGHDELILRTEDGGENWIAEHYAPDSQQPLLDLWFENRSRGIAIGAYGAYYETRNGGRDWEPRKFEYQALPKPKPAPGAEDLGEDIPPDYHLNKIVAAGSRLYIAAEAGQLFRSDDGGAIWRQLPSPYNGSFFGLLALSADEVLAFGLRGNVFRSRDAGLTWLPVVSGTEAMLTDGLRRADGALVLVGLSGTVLVSRDNGASWTLQQQTDRKGISAALLAGGELVIAGEAGVRRVALGANK